MKHAFLATFILALAVAGATTLPFPTHTQARSSAIPYDFERDNPCPQTHERYGPCPGFIKDHIIPLCAGGPDSTANMQWQTVVEAKDKDRWEKQLCRQMKWLHLKISPE